MLLKKAIKKKKTKKTDTVNEYLMQWCPFNMRDQPVCSLVMVLRAEAYNYILSAIKLTKIGWKRNFYFSQANFTGWWLQSATGLPACCVCVQADLWTGQFVFSYRFFLYFESSGALLSYIFHYFYHNLIGKWNTREGIRESRIDRRRHVGADL